MSSRTMNFGSATALANIAKMIEFLAPLVDASTTDIADHLCMSSHHAAQYLRVMSSEGTVHRTKRAKACSGGSLPARWAIGQGALHEDKDIMPRKVTTSKVWDGAPPPMFEPMAYLFGRAA